MFPIREISSRYGSSFSSRVRLDISTIHNLKLVTKQVNKLSIYTQHGQYTIITLFRLKSQPSGNLIKSYIIVNHATDVYMYA